MPRDTNGWIKAIEIFKTEQPLEYSANSDDIALLRYWFWVRHGLTLSQEDVRSALRVFYHPDFDDIANDSKPTGSELPTTKKKVTHK
jgi:hypothetical protein